MDKHIADETLYIYYVIQLEHTHFANQIPFILQEGTIMSWKKFMT